MAEAPKLEITTREAVLAVAFIFLVVFAVALAQAGIITNPLTLGLMVTLTIGLIIVGHFMVRAKVFSSSMLPLWYVLTFGIVMLAYGGIQAGFIPAAFVYSGASVMEIAVTNAMFYTLVALAIVAAVAAIYAGYRYYKRKAGAL